MSMPRDVQVLDPETATTTDTEYVVLGQEELEKPYRVILQNDDITPTEVVVLILNSVFDIPPARAITIMLTAHNNGRALVTVLPFEEASERVYSAQSLARDAGFPLSFYLEPDE
ncbi:MAG TPA: ATP-dependent Clp protease adaptor ClpS [Herpetosiphonaceae bacterium]